MGLVPELHVVPLSLFWSAVASEARHRFWALEFPIAFDHAKSAVAAALCRRSPKCVTAGLAAVSRRADETSMLGVGVELLPSEF
jgi:hypothetical protein